MNKLWYHILDNNDKQSAELFLSIIKNNGVRPVPLKERSDSTPGIIFFSEADQEHIDFVKEIDCGGLARILALCPSYNSDYDIFIWRLIQAGVSDVLFLDSIGDLPRAVTGRIKRWTEIDEIVFSPLVKNNLIGGSRVWITALRRIVEAARYTTAPIVIYGESGTGKELAARLVHTLDQRKNKKEIVILDVTTIVPELAGSEFFGHERGAFTGAVSARKGAFALADRGTLFLDEVGELPLSLQPKFLRVMQEKTYKPLGSEIYQKTDFRLVCATNKWLPSCVKDGNFRSDLYHRIAGWEISLPPLDDRREDILPLAAHFLEKYYGKGESPEISRPVRDFLINRDYPGNVRDLEKLVYRMSFRHVGNDPICIGDIPEDSRPQIDNRSISADGEELERGISRALYSGMGYSDIKKLVGRITLRKAMEISKNKSELSKNLKLTLRRTQQLTKDSNEIA